MSALFDAIAAVLAFFYEIWPSFGGAIILLTLSVMVLMTPLTLKGTKSMMAMQRLQPEMKKIQDKHKDDREKLNEELLAFYKENNINPLGGCLPLVLQAPVFIVLYRIISGLALAASRIGLQGGWTSGQLLAGGALTMVPEGVAEQPFEPTYLDHSSQLYRDLAGATTMPFLGLDLAQSASKALSEGIVAALPYLTMIAIVGLSGWYQQHQTQARSTSEPNPQQKTIARVMLIFLPLISFGLPAGVVLYFVVSNLYRVGMQAYITKTMFSDEDAVAVGSSSKNEKGGKGASGGKGGASSTGPKPKPAPKKPSGGRGRTYTADPSKKRKGGAGPPQAAEPRARKKKRKT